MQYFDEYPENEISRSEVMERLGLSLKSIRKIEKKGQLKPFHVRQNLVMYELTDVERWIADHNAELTRKMRSL